MGLDGVEIILAVEDHFSLDIEDEEASKVMTVGDLRDLVVARLQEGRSQRAPLHAATFHRVRRALMRALPCSRVEIRPDTSQDSLLPTDRRAAWRRLSENLHLRLLRLERPPSLEQRLNLVRAVPVVTGVVSSLSTCGKWHHAVAGLVVGCVAGGIGSYATRRHAVHVPRSCETVERLVYTVVGLERHRQGHAHVAAGPDQVLADIIDIGSEHLGIERERIHADSRWVDDLGAD